jgi:glycosyltransferase involved in cell wall biosynthesis
VRSGIAADTAALLPHLERDFAIECFDEPRAHDFVWKYHRAPYDLVVYQLGNARCHDYMWAYLARYPGLAVLHDPRLHHARARQLLMAGREEDYRRELHYDHPDLTHGFAEYAIAGLGGAIYYLWSMIGVVMRTARMVAVYNPRVAAELREVYPDTPIAAIRLGTAPLSLVGHRFSGAGAEGTIVDPTHVEHRSSGAGAARIRTALGIPETSVAFAVFGTVTAEKRIGPILRAFAGIVRDGADAHLLLAGDAAGYPSLGADIESSGLGDRIHVTGYVEDEAIGDYLGAADVCLCLRWPTAQETSAAWLNALAAARPTVISDLAHLVDIPSADPRNWRAFPANVEPVAVRIDLLDEEESLRLAMKRLASDADLRDRLARAGHAYWQSNHTMAATADDYRAIIREAVTRPAPTISDLPPHFTDDYSSHAREIVSQFGIALEDLWSKAGRAG